MGYYYAVAKGRNPGIYMTWDECKSQVHQFTGAKYKKFGSREEAEAFVGGNSSLPSKSSHSTSSMISNKKNENSIFNSNRRKYSTYNDDKSDEPSRKRSKVELISTSSSSLLHTELKQVGQHYFQVDNDGYVNVWTDGACSKNGRSNAKAGIGVFFGFNHPLNISRPVDTRSTNNYAEIKAVTEAAKQANKYGVNKLKINTDSMFLINCINNWMPKWKRNNWVGSSGAPVINKNELIEMEKVLQKVNSIKWNHVRGHQGNIGNEMADQLARNGAEQN